MNPARSQNSIETPRRDQSRSSRFDGVRSGVMMAATLGVMGVLGLLSGCAHPPGVDVMNKTGQTLNVEYMSVTSDGSAQTYSRGVVSNESNVLYRVDQTDNDGVRIRFSLPNAPEADGTFIVLNPPKNQTKYYDLEYTAGRLVARERKKGQIQWYREE